MLYLELGRAELKPLENVLCFARWRVCQTQYRPVLYIIPVLFGDVGVGRVIELQGILFGVCYTPSGAQIGDYQQKSPVLVELNQLCVHLFWHLNREDMLVIVGSGHQVS